MTKLEDWKGTAIKCFKPLNCKWFHEELRCIPFMLTGLLLLYLEPSCLRGRRFVRVLLITERFGSLDFHSIKTTHLQISHFQVK